MSGRGKTKKQRSSAQREVTTSTTHEVRSSSRSSSMMSPPSLSESTILGSPAASHQSSSGGSHLNRGRIEEKAQLCNLNDRLAAYIERVRYLENENAKLEAQMREYEVVETRERTNITQAYERELADARKHIDELSGEKAKLQIQVDKNNSEVLNQKQRLAELEKLLDESERKRGLLSSQCTDLEGKAKHAESRLGMAEEQLKNVTRERDNLQRQLDAARADLEDEVLSRTKHEDTITSLKEELRFEKGLRAQEVAEHKERREREFTARTRDLETNFQAQLAKELENNRRFLLEDQLAKRKEMQDMYERKLEDMSQYQSTAREQAAEARQEAMRYKSQLEVLEKEKNGFDAQLDGLRSKLKTAEENLRFTEDMWKRKCDHLFKELELLNARHEEQLRNYQDLMDTKVQLDNEIDAYRVLLESEESRLNLTPSEYVSPGGTVTTEVHEGSASATGGRRGVKRRRVDEAFGVARRQLLDTSYFKSVDSKDGPIEISAHAEDSGDYVQLKNSSDKEFGIGNFEVRRRGKDEQGSSVEITYKFPARSRVKPGQKVTVWSADAADAKHKPPADYKMNERNFPSGDYIISELFDTDGKQVAYRESTKQHGTRGAHEFGGAVDDEQRCSIM